jgi:hypothetical protein
MAKGAMADSSANRRGRGSVIKIFYKEGEEKSFYYSFKMK